MEEKVSFTNKVYQSLKDIADNCWLQFKVTLTNPILLFMIFAFPIILLAGVGLLIKETSIFVAVFGTVQVVSIGIIYGYLNYSINNSTFNDNMNLTKYKGYQKMLSMIITTIVISVIIFTIQLLIMCLCESLNFIFMDGFVFQGEETKGSIDINWNGLNYSAIYTFWIQTYMVSMSIYYFASCFFASQRTFSIFVLLFMIVNLTFGRCMAEQWLYYNPNIKEFVPSSWVGDWKAEQLGLDPEWVETWDGWNMSGSSFHAKTWIDYTTFFLPQTFNNMHFFSVFKVGANQTSSIDWGPFDVKTLAEGTHFMYLSKYDTFWNFTVIAPYLYSSILVFFAWIIKKK